MKEKAPHRFRKLYVVGSVQSESLEFLLRTLKAAGYNAELIVLFSQRDYRLGHSGGVVPRLLLRLKLTLGFPLWLLLEIFTKRRSGIFIVTTNPFFAPLLVSISVRAKGSLVVQLLYDLYPDALEKSPLRLRYFLSYFLGKLTSLTQKLVAGTVYLGPFLKRHAEYRWGRACSSAVIDVGCDHQLFPSNQTNQPKAVPNIPIEIHLGGQLGHMHDVPRTSRALRFAFDSTPSLRKNFVLSCYATGPYLSVLKETCATLPMTFFSPQPDWPRVVSKAALGFVCLSPKGASICLPSRVYSMMAGGLAVIAMCPLWSDLATLILNARAGWVINNSPYRAIEELEGPDYPSKLHEAREPDELGAELGALLLRLSHNPDEVEERRTNAAKVSNGSYGLKPLSEKWSTYLANLQT